MFVPYGQSPSALTEALDRGGQTRPYMVGATLAVALHAVAQRAVALPVALHADHGRPLKPTVQYQGDFLVAGSWEDRLSDSE